jgi:MFS family permease
MNMIRNVMTGPWRAVLVLGVTQIMAWAALFYPPVLTLPLIAKDQGWSMTFAMGGFSFGLLTAGLVAPRVGAAIDRFGGHVVMPFGSLLGAVGLVGLAHTESPLTYLFVWAVLGAAMAASLYDPAFATLGRIFGTRARSPITALTLAGGFASTVSWPATHFLITAVGWRGTYLFYAALLAFVAAPLHAFALPRARAGPDAVPHEVAITAPAYRAPKGIDFILVATAFASYAFVPSALSAHLLAVFQRSGLEANAAVMVGTLFGPSQVAARLVEFVFARNVSPLAIARLAVGLLVAAFALIAVAGLSVLVAAIFMIMFGAANGLITIARGTVPLSLFGAAGYGRLIGRIAGPSLMMQALAPSVLALTAEQSTDATALGVAAGFTIIALVSFLVIRPHRHKPD